MRTDEILDQIDGALDDWGVGPDAMRCGAPAGAGLTSGRSAPRTITAFVQVDVRPFQEAMNRFAAALAAMTPKIWKLHRIVRQLDEREAASRHQPIPLSIDGRAYQQRQRNRRRRSQ